MGKNRPEENLQIAIVDYIQRVCKGVMVFSSSNGMWLGRNANAANYIMKLKKAGLRPGEPDLRLHWAKKNNPIGSDIQTSSPKTLYLEVKIKPNKPTEAQANCIAELTNLGFPVEVVYTLDEAIAAIKIHGVPCRQNHQ